MPRDQIVFETDESILRAEIEDEMVRFAILTDVDDELRHSLDVIELDTFIRALEEMKQRILINTPDV